MHNDGCSKGLYYDKLQEHHDSFPLLLCDCQERRVSCPFDQHHVFCRRRIGFSHPALQPGLLKIILAYN